MTKSKIQNLKSSWPLVIVSLCLVAIRPWMRLELVCSDDISLHLLRTAQLEALLRQGVLYSRWAPTMALGYGYPFYNFYAPLSYYIAALLTLAGLAIRPALFATFALAPIGAGLGAYLLVRDHFSPRSALIAAVAYAYAPYLAYDAYFRGNLAETFAWIFPPLALWAVGRLARQGNRRYLALTALAYAAILLTHNVFALIFSPLLATYGLTMALTAPPASARLRRLIAVAAACLLGLGLAAFFWLPALAERAYVHSDRLLVPPIFVYWNNFIDWRELLALPQAIHPDLMNPSPLRGLGLVPVLLCLPALAGLCRFRDRSRRVQVIFFAVALALYAWLTTASSRFIWDHLPLIEYVQFPWRLLGPAALCLAVLAAAAADLLPANWRGSLVTAFAILLLVLSALFWLDPRYCPWGESFSSADTIIAFEHHTHVIGTTAKGEYLPRAVEAMPEEDATTPLASSGIPTGTVVVQREAVPIGAELVITTTQPFTATYNGFYYPGWRVTMDGSAIPITVEPLYGRITFRVPAGSHRVSVHLGETPLRLAADVVSAACLALTVGLLLSRSRAFNSAEWNPRLQAWWAWALWGLALFGLVALLYRVDTPLRNPRLRDGRLPGLDMELNIPFEGGPTLLGFDQPQTTVPSGGHIRMDLYWTAWERPLRRYQHTINILDSAGLRWNRLDSLPPRNFREPPDTWLWDPGFYAEDSHTIEPLPGTPPGVYDLSLVLFDLETLAPLRVLEANGQPGPPALPLGQITVTRPLCSPNPDEVEMQHRLNANLGALTLAGVDLDRTEAAPGDPFLATFYWLADETPSVDLTARLALVAADGSVAAAFDLPPTSASHPTTAWQAGDFWRGQHVLNLPAHLENGDYTWRLTLLPTGQSINLPIPLHVTAPPHSFTAPVLQHPIGVTLGGLATLAGFDLSLQEIKPGDTLTVTLVWRAEAETHTSYRVFLHLRTADGALVAQSDGIPANWSRPTTGWLPGEYVADARALTVPPDTPPGPYTLTAGLYVPDGGRLTTPDGSDAIQLTTITTEAP
jgi:hypothetical protein